MIAVNKAGESPPSDPSDTHTVWYKKCKYSEDKISKIFMQAQLELSTEIKVLCLLFREFLIIS